MALAVGCDGAAPTETPAQEPSPSQASDAAPRMQTLRLEPVLTAQRFESPTNLAQTGDGRVWITEQEGRIWVAAGPDAGGGGIRKALDLTDRVSSRRSEEGLLGLAFDPADERLLYVYYSAAGPRRSVVSRFTLSPNGMTVASDSELVILEVRQPYANHNGGQLAFGPDGYLYIGLGDGGSAGDPQGHGQDTATLLGAILRIDVSQAAPARPYAIPPDNPLAGGDGRAEIWAYGLRNPWRFSFDRDTGALWAGDVGQNRWEEIDLIRRGGNYGWNALEGNHCFQPRDDCELADAVPPVWEYPLDGAPCSVIGGYVYRGSIHRGSGDIDSGIPWLRGVYLYGDYCSGEVFGLRYVNGGVAEHQRLADTGLRIMSFAEDTQGAVYLLSQESGIFRLVAE